MSNDYIRRQAVEDAMTQSVCGDTWEVEKAIEAVRQLPADVAPVVRCKDCKHFYFADNRIPQEQRYVCEISGEIWKPDSFCSYGERKE